MNLQNVTKSILNYFIASYTTTPFRINNNKKLIDPTDGNTAKKVDQVQDFIEFYIFPQDSSRAIVNAQDSGRWVTGFIRVNAFDQINTGDTAVNGVRTDELLGIVDGIFSEQTYEDANVKITFRAGIGPNHVGEHPEYQRYEGFMRWNFRAVFK